MAAALLMANLQGNLRSQYAIALDQPQRFLRLVNELFTRTQPITLMPRFSLPIMTTSRDDCAMQIAGIFLVFCSGTMAPWSGLIPRVLCWGFFRSWNCLM